MDAAELDDNHLCGGLPQHQLTPPPLPWLRASTDEVVRLACVCSRAAGVSLELSALGSWQQSAEVTIRAARGMTPTPTASYHAGGILISRMMQESL